MFINKDTRSEENSKKVLCGIEEVEALDDIIRFADSFAQEKVDNILKKSRFSKIFNLEIEILNSQAIEGNDKYRGVKAMQIFATVTHYLPLLPLWGYKLFPFFGEDILRDTDSSVENW